MSKQTDHCPETFGSEKPEHTIINVTASSDGNAPYRKCAKCGERWPDDAVPSQHQPQGGGS